jgi:hypothetical protein
MRAADTEAPRRPKKPLTKLLEEIDGHLGLAVHRGEGSQEAWNREANGLIIRIRQWLDKEEK